MFYIRTVTKDKFRWLKFPFAALPARMESGRIRLRLCMRGAAGRGCPISYRIEENEGGKFRQIGYLGLYNLDFRKSAELGMEIYEEKRGEGIGRTSLGLFMKGVAGYSFLKELAARVRPDNGPALRLLKGSGFKEEPSGADGFRRFRFMFESSALKLMDSERIPCGLPQGRSNPG